MRSAILTPLMIMLFLSILPSVSVSETFSAADIPEIRHLLENAISNSLIEGGVVVTGDHRGILTKTAMGKFVKEGVETPIDGRTIFDVASLTKVIATAPAIMKLAEEGSISLLDPVARWFPEFRGSAREDMTILHLLTHTSGLRDIEINEREDLSFFIRRVAFQKFLPFHYSTFKYADVNYMILGELVRRVTGKALDIYAAEKIYSPLQMAETTFLPSPSNSMMIAPTSSNYQAGVVQDENARRLGGVAGHAGLFSTADDLAIFGRLLLNKGRINEMRILESETVRQMTVPYACNNGAVRRGLGWDIDSSFSAPKWGAFSESSYGHTGYSGSSIWIDPERDFFVIFLSVRTNYRDKKLFNQLRNDISVAAALNYGIAGQPIPDSVRMEVLPIPPHSNQGIIEAQKHFQRANAKIQARHKLTAKKRKLAKAPGINRSRIKKRILES